MTVTDVFNLKALFPRLDGKFLLQHHEVGVEIVLCVFTIFVCLVGLVGNGNIIWLLGFRIKRKPFAVYLLNLAVIDFGLLAFLLPLRIILNILLFYEYVELNYVLIILLVILLIWIYSSLHLLLAAISMERCVSVLFPNWYRRHWPPVLSTIVCAFIWALTVALSGVPLILFSMDLIPFEFFLGHVVTPLICLILTSISTLTQLIKVCLKSQPCQCGNLSKVILLILLFHLLFTILEYLSVIMFSQLGLEYYALWISLKGSINPLIYFLAGRQNGGQFQERMKAILQRVFKEERDARMERPPLMQTSNL